MREFSYDGKRTYATFANAQKAGRKMAESFQTEDLRWTVAATAEGRFYPLAIYNNERGSGALGALAWKGFCVVN
jgi:hypothetical protein